MRAELASAQAVVADKERTLGQLMEERTFLNSQVAGLREELAAKAHASPAALFGSGAAPAAAAPVGDARPAFRFGDGEAAAVAAPPTTGGGRKRGAQREDDSEEEEGAAPEVEMGEVQEEEVAEPGTAKPARKRVKAVHHSGAGAAAFLALGTAGDGR